MRTYLSLLVLTACLLGSGCQPAPAATSIAFEVTPSLTPEPLVPTQGVEQMTPSLSTPADQEVQNLIELTTQDLATRLDVPSAEISLVEATAVEWSDSSLDCPQEGMSYLQVITPGYRIVLQANNQPYEYHTNRTGYFVHCNNRVPPIIPQP